VCFNVYLETQERYEAYLARLQNIAGDRPLLMTGATQPLGPAPELAMRVVGPGG